MIEIVTFEDKRWDEIPQQDNPAFDYVYENNRLQEGFKGRRNACILITKVMPYRSKGVGENGYNVTEVPINGDVIGRGLFWNLKDATLFAEALSQNGL